MSYGVFNSNIKRIENKLSILYYYRNDIESTKWMTSLLDKKLTKRYNPERKRQDNAKNFVKYKQKSLGKVR